MNRAEEWFELAEEDRRVAKWALQEGIYNQVCFHAQQGTEKALKGFLRSHNQNIPKNRSLLEILSYCVALDQTMEEIRGECRKLQAYYNLPVTLMLYLAHYLKGCPHRKMPKKPTTF